MVLKMGFVRLHSMVSADWKQATAYLLGELWIDLTRLGEHSELHRQFGYLQMLTPPVASDAGQRHLLEV